MKHRFPGKPIPSFPMDFLRLCGIAKCQHATLASPDKDLRPSPRAPSHAPPPQSHISPPPCGTEMSRGGGRNWPCLQPALTHPVPGGLLASWPRSRAPHRQPGMPRRAPVTALLARPPPWTPLPEMPRSRGSPSSLPHGGGGGRRHTSAGRGAGRGPAERGGRQRSAPGDPRAHKGPFVAAAGARKEPLSRGRGCFLLERPDSALLQGARGRWGLSRSPGLPGDPVLLQLEAGERCQGHPQHWCTGRVGAHLLPPPRIGGGVVPSALCAGDGAAGHPEDREEAPSQELTRHSGWTRSSSQPGEPQKPRGPVSTPPMGRRGGGGTRQPPPSLLPPRKQELPLPTSPHRAAAAPCPHPASSIPGGLPHICQQRSAYQPSGAKGLAATASSDGWFSAAFSVTLGQGAFPTGEGRASPGERQLSAFRCCRAG